MDHVVQIRVASKLDLPEILRLYAQPEMDDGRVLPLAEAERTLERMWQYPHYKLYVAVRDQQIVGTFVLLIMDNLVHGGVPSAILEAVVVDPAMQGQGLGKMMTRFAIKLASENGCYKMLLSSNLKRKRAHEFYESLGFERHGYSFRMELPDQ